MMSESQRSSATPNGSNGSLKRRWTTAVGKLESIGQLIGWESIRRTMRREDDLADRDARAYHKALHGDTVPDEEMGDFSGNLVMGDMHTSPKKNGRNGLLPFILGAGLTAAGAYYGVPWLKDLVAPAVTAPDTNTRYDIDGSDGGVW